MLHFQSLKRLSFTLRRVLFAFATLSATVAGVPSAADGQAVVAPSVQHLTATELRSYADSLAARAAREPGRQIPGRPLGRDSVLAMVLLRRDSSSRPEVHEQVADVFVIQAGRGVVVSGGRVEGAQLMEPGEWNGGRILPDTATSGGRSLMRRPAVPGDVVVIPAGVPHQMEVAPGEFVTYLVLKLRRAGPGSTR